MDIKEGPSSSEFAGGGSGGDLGMLVNLMWCDLVKSKLFVQN